MSKICSRCNAENPPEARFCESCGSALGAEPAKFTAEPSMPPSAPAQTIPHSQPVPPQPQFGPQYQPPDAPKKKSKGGLIAGIICGILAFIIAGTAVFLTVGGYWNKLFGGNDSIVGVWSTTMSESGVEYELSIEFTEDSEVIYSIMGMSIEGTYSIDGDMLTLSLSSAGDVTEESGEFKIDGNTLTLIDEGGIDLVLQRED